jgi:hypothetical protein
MKLFLALFFLLAAVFGREFENEDPAHDFISKISRITKNIRRVPGFGSRRRSFLRRAGRAIFSHESPEE